MERLVQVVKDIIKYSSITVIIIGIAGLAFMSSMYTVDEGHVGVIKRFGKAVSQVDPGLHFKAPFIDDVKEIEVRTKKNVETMPVATSEQMRAVAKVSVNWTVDRNKVLELYKKYGSLKQFEERILDPKLREAAKAGIAKFTAEENINQRNKVTSVIYDLFTKEIKGYPITINSMQYEDIQLPKKYLESIDRKQTAKNERDAEKYRLEKQALEAQRAVNTAKAQRDAAKAKADGIAYKIKVEAQAKAEKIKLIASAQAEAIKKKALALQNNKALIEYEKALRWNGQLPQTVLGSDQNLFMNLK